MGYELTTTASQWESHDKRESQFQSSAQFRLQAKLRPARNRIDLLIEVSNLGPHGLAQVWSDGGDLQQKTPAFMEAGAPWSYIRTSSGLERLADLHRTLRIRSVYAFDEGWYEEPAFRRWEDFWGRSKARPIEGFIATEATQGARAVGIGFDRAFKLMQNSDYHHCLHASPYFGTLEPGESKALSGVILFGTGAEQLFGEFQTLGYRPYVLGPE